MEKSIIRMRVSKHDCDENNQLYYGSVNVFFQQGEDELFRTEQGSKRIFRDKHNIAYACVGVHWEMFGAAVYDEELRVETHIEDLRGKTYYLVHEIYRGDSQECIAKGWVKRICVKSEDGKVRASDLPEEVSESIKDYVFPATSVPTNK